MRFFMLCVLGIRSRDLPLSWGDNPGSISYSIYLTGWVTHDQSTAVRATTSLGGERAHQRCLFSPLPTVFSRALFSTTLPTLGENERAEPFPQFHDIDLFISVLCSIMGMCNLQVYAIGGWGRRKAGDWGRKPERGRGIAAGLPPLSPGCLPKTTVERYCVCQARRA